MASGPYKSKLLRLVFGQFQNSRERYRQTARQVRMAAVEGAVVGGAWVLVPIKAIFQISKRLTSRWQQMAGASRTRQTKLPNADEAITQAVFSIGKCLSTQQRQEIQTLSPIPTHASMHQAEHLQLSLYSTGGAPIKGWLKGWSKGLSKGLSKSKGWWSRLSHRLGQMRSNHVRQITGFASDIETRDTVLVLDYTTVWHGLTTAQQHIIRRKIAALSTDYGDLLWTVVQRERRSQSSLTHKSKQLPGQQSFGGNAIAQVISLLEQSLSIQQGKEIQRIQLIPGETTAQLKLPASTSAISLVKYWFTSLSLRSNWIKSKRKIQITGFASDLETRNTVLVFENKIVWDGLSHVQQERVKRKIATLVFEGEIIQVVDSNELISLLSQLSAEEIDINDVVRAHCLSGENGLVQAIRSFWVDVLWAVVHRSRTQQRLSLPFWQERLQAGQQFFWNALTDADGEISLFLTRTLSDKTSLSALQAASSANRNNPNSIDADVISSSYIERPLERLLKWLDQGLLFLEQHVQRLIDWMLHVLRI